MRSRIIDLTRALAWLVSVCVVASAAHAQPAATQAARPGCLFIMGTVTDREAMARYAITLPANYAQHGGRPIANGRVGVKVRVLEGQFAHQSNVLSKFASIDGPNALTSRPTRARSSNDCAAM